MNREEYLSELYGRLRQRLPAGELENTMKYYEEYFNEAGPAREEEIVAELGSPEDLALQILSGHGFTSPNEYRYETLPYKRDWTAGKVVLLICLFPIWLPLLIAIPITLFSVVVAVGAAGLGCIAGGVVFAWCGFTAIFIPGFTTTMFFGGAGLVLVAVGLLLFAASIALGRVCGKGVGALLRWLFVGGRRGVAV